MTNSAVVYDLDGTLVRLQVDWAAAERQVREVLTEAGVSTDADHRVWPLLDVADELGLTGAVEECVAAHEREGARRATRLPLADEVEALDRPAAICSLNCEAACRIALERHDLLGQVRAVVGRDTVTHRKPHPQPLLAAVDALDVDPADTLFVGDSESDAICADRAGVRFVHVSDRVSAQRR